MVVDIFAGSNTTGRACENNRRRWLAMELDPDCVATSALRFMEHLPEAVRETFEKLRARTGRLPVDLTAPASLFDAQRVGAAGG